MHNSQGYRLPIRRAQGKQVGGYRILKLLCVYAVEKVGKSCGEGLGLCSLSTKIVKYLTSKVFFRHSLWTFNPLKFYVFAQVKYGLLHRYVDGLSTFSTGPNEFNKLSYLGVVV